MKNLRKLGLVAVAAMALMAFVGAGSASATVLCKVTETPCSAANKYPIGTFADGSLAPGTSANFTDTAGNPILTCTGGTIKGELEKTGSATETPRGKGTAANVVWTGCSSPMQTIAGGEVEVHHITGTDNGTVTVKQFVTTVQVFGVSCRYGYGLGTDIGTLTGGLKPTLDVNVIINEAEPKQFLCPDTMKGVASGVLTEPKELPVYVEPE